MRTLQFARTAGREERKKIGEAVEGLVDRLVGHLKAKGIDVVAVGADQLDGGRAEIDVASGLIQIDESLDEPTRREVLAHELGHLVMHGRLTDPTAPFDPVLASAYGDAGPAAIARYSPRAREEAEANAFALEFICPSDMVFEMWWSERGVSIDALAERISATEHVVRVQLANRLHDFAIGDDASNLRTKPPRVSPTQEQGDAARCTGRPTLIDAGPGTGKTATLIARIEYLLTDLGVSPQQIFVVSFSNEAAQELTQRIEDRFGRAVADRITTSTFHGFGMEFLHLHGGLLGFENEPLLIDEDAQAELMYEIIGRVACPNLITLRNPWETAEELVEHVNHCKHCLIEPDEVLREVVKWTAIGANPKDLAAAGELIAIYREYERVKHERHQVDFADLISLPLGLLESRADVRTAWQAKFKHVLVDEFQDVSRATSRLLRALCGEENPPWVVGDARQAIYRFLGASPDNVTKFHTDFPGATVFRLGVNYRSSEPIIRAANELAAIMNPDHGSSWRRGSEEEPLGPEPVVIVEASSDAAERVGIANKIRHWITQDHIAPGDIAVLARRHIDVRETMLALEETGIRAQAAGLLTAEGAAGDLAAVLSLVDSPLASVPRLVYAFGRDSSPPTSLNAIVRDLLQNKPVEGEIAQQIRIAREAAERERFSGDGWIALTTYLFESSSYLRNVLARADTPERAMSLIEIVSTLSLAASYRATHKGATPRLARIGFAQRLRARLTKTVPLPLMPKPRADSVRVMTCHASKGLEFPCVIVSSQTVPRTSEKYPWLPPQLRPLKNEEDEQANSLLFVGITRAKRAVVVSYPRHAGETALAKEKKVVPLLDSWRQLGLVPLRTWGEPVEARAKVIAGPVWGLRPRNSIKASSLDADACPLLTYLEEILGIRFAEEETVLYPQFFGAVRRILRQISALANEIGHQVSEAEVFAMVDKEWSDHRFRDHVHSGMYREIATRMALGFSREFVPTSGNVTMEPEIWLVEDDTKPKVVLDLVAYFKQLNGSVLVVGFRPESFAAMAKDGKLGWSKLDKNKRISLILAEHLAGLGVTMPKVFSGLDGRIYDFQWSIRKDSFDNQAAQLLSRFQAIAHSNFATEATPYTCDRCRARVTCPRWIGALER